MLNLESYKIALENHLVSSFNNIFYLISNNLDICFKIKNLECVTKLKSQIVKLADSYVINEIYFNLFRNSHIYTNYFVLDMYDLNTYELNYEENTSAKISLIVPNDCLKKLNSTLYSYYPTLKIDWFPSIQSGKTSLYLTNEIELYLYDPKNVKKYDNDYLSKLCKDLKLDYYVYSPIPQSYSETYKKYSSLNIDLFNSNDRFFTDRCYVYPTNSTNIPLLYRKKEMFLGMSIKCGAECNFKNITELYIICSCQPINYLKIEVGKETMDTSTIFNFDLVICSNTIIFNLGLIILIILLLIAIVSIILSFYCFDRNLKKNFKSIIYNDSNLLISKQIFEIDGKDC